MAGQWTKPLIVVVIVIMAYAGFRWFIAEPLLVSSSSMSPTIAGGDILLVNKLTPRLEGVHPGDIVMVRKEDGERIVKRIAAVQGQTFEVDNSKILINGVEVPEPYVKEYNPSGLFYSSLTVPAGEVFLLGDNRIQSVDSRQFGPVPLSWVVGKVSIVVPLGDRQVSATHG